MALKAEIFSKSLNNGNKFDLIITDFQMPGMNGVEMAREIKKLEKELGLDAPTIIVSSETHLICKECKRDMRLFDAILDKKSLNCDGRLAKEVEIALDFVIAKKVGSSKDIISCAKLLNINQNPGRPVPRLI